MKEKLIILAKEKEFVSEIIGKSVESKYSKKDFYYLWMCELQKWLRDKHNCIIEVLFHSDEYYKDCFDNKNDILYQVTIDYYGEFFQLKQTEHSDYNETHLSSYEEGLEIGVYKALNLIKNGNKD